MLFYNFIIFLYWCIIHLVSLFNDKARKWVSGRKNIFSAIEKTVREKKIIGDIIWFHCASLGEFEQGRPVIEGFKKSNPTVKIVLTFFSPSGYEIRKDYAFADAVFYLPLDFKSNAKQFIKLINPKAAVFIKYEFWLNYIAELNAKNIPIYLISAVFRPNQHFFKWYGSIFFNALKSYKKVFLQDKNSFQLLKEKGLSNIEIAGDTRFDRVFEIAQTKTALPVVDGFCNNHTVLIAGSTWPKDEQIVIETFKKLKEKHPHLKLIIASHEVNKHATSRIENLMGNTKYSLYTNPTNIESADILLIDTIGILSQLYRYGTASYIGGGFNDGIHNILEALVYNIPVAFGTNHHKFVEASEALQLNMAKEINSSDELFVFLNKVIADENYRHQLSLEIKNYMQNKAGATNKILLELNAISI
jgi:3-deoxy-D-manno-octulosonic-acid transferase